MCRDQADFKKGREMLQPEGNSKQGGRLPMKMETWESTSYFSL